MRVAHQHSTNSMHIAPSTSMPSGMSHPNMMRGSVGGLGVPTGPGGVWDSLSSTESIPQMDTPEESDVENNERNPAMSGSHVATGGNFTARHFVPNGQSHSIGSQYGKTHLLRFAAIQFTSDDGTSNQSVSTEILCPPYTVNYFARKIVYTAAGVPAARLLCQLIKISDLEKIIGS